MSDARHDWEQVLAPTPDCLALERLGEELTANEREHVESCVRCQTELALFRDIDAAASSAEENDAAQWIAAELQRRNGSNIVAFRPKRMRVLYAVAAMLVIVLGAGWWMQMREPSFDPTSLDDVYRSARLELVLPKGDLVQPPNELRWRIVPHTSHYVVSIFEVDATPVWSTQTTQTSVALPPEVAAQFAPGKTLRWQVKAFRGTEMLAASETQNVRLTVASRKAR